MGFKHPFPPFQENMVMSEPVHPGTIKLIDVNTMQVTRTVEAWEVPFPARFVKTKRGLVPVMVVLAHQVGDRRVISEYGPNDELLRSQVKVSLASVALNLPRSLPRVRVDVV